MKKKSILFVVNNFNIGGPQKSLLSLLHYLDFNLYNVDLLIMNGEDSLSKYLPDEVNLINSPMLVKYSTLSPQVVKQNTISLLFSNKIKFVFKAIPIILKGFIKKNITQKKQEYWQEVKQELPTNKKEYDIAIGVSGGHSIMYIVDCVKAKKKIGWIRTDYRVLNRNHKIDEMYFQKMNTIISVSELTKNIFIEMFPNEKNKVEVMYNVSPFHMYKNIKTDTSVMTQFNNYTKLLTISRLDPNKGLDLAINTLEILLQKGYKIKWFVLGSGKHEAEIIKLIKKKNLEDSFILLGFHFNTAAFMNDCDIIVHPSYFEGKSNVVDEAKYLLKPIVATNYETVNEQLSDNKTGLISEMNPVSLSKKLELLLKDKSIKSKLKENLRHERKNDYNNVEQFYDIINS